MPTARFPSDSRCCGDSMPWIQTVPHQMGQGSVGRSTRLCRVRCARRTASTRPACRFLRDREPPRGKRLRPSGLAACRIDITDSCQVAYCARVAQVRSKVARYPVVRAGGGFAQHRLRNHKLSDQVERLIDPVHADPDGIPSPPLRAGLGRGRYQPLAAPRSEAALPVVRRRDSAAAPAGPKSPCRRRPHPARQHPCSPDIGELRLGDARIRHRGRQIGEKSERAIVVVIEPGALRPGTVGRTFDAIRADRHDVLLAGSATNSMMARRLSAAAAVLEAYSCQGVLPAPAHTQDRPKDASSASRLSMSAGLLRAPASGTKTHPQHGHGIGSGGRARAPALIARERRSSRARIAAAASGSAWPSPRWAPTGCSLRRLQARQASTARRRSASPLRTRSSIVSMTWVSAAMSWKPKRSNPLSNVPRGRSR